MGKVSSKGWLIVSGLLAALAIGSVFSTAAIAEVQQFEVKSYQQSFGLSAETAERNLEIQQQGAGIVEQLENAQDSSRFAGVWFDNEAGEFVVPLVAGAGRQVIGSQLAAVDLGNDFRTVSVRSSWEELEAAQDRLDKALIGLIGQGLVQTSLDPRTNAVVLDEAQGVNDADRARIRSLAAGESAQVEVRQESTERFGISARACQINPVVICDRPMRGGVNIVPSGSSGTGGGCTAGFNATGNGFGNKFVLTAGHCVPIVKQWASFTANGTPHYLGVVSSSSFGTGHDYAAINANGTYWSEISWPSIVVKEGVNQEHPITAESSSYIGQWVCHTGQQSGTSCGYVVGAGVTTSFTGGEPLFNATQFSGEVCSIDGDSGGPVFAGNTALGLYSGDENWAGCTGTIGVYTELTEDTDALGVSVAPRVGAPPVAKTTNATGVYATQANLNGYVDPNGISTSYHFEYGPTTAYGSNTVGQNAGAGWQPSLVTTTITGLHGLTNYHFRLVASNSSGTSYGPDQQFATPAPPPSVSELGFVRYNGSGNTYFDGYVGAPAYKGLAVTGETGYPKVTDPQNVQSLAIDIDGEGLDELGFVRFNGSGNTHLDAYVGAPGYKTLGSYCDTGYPKISDPKNVQAVALDMDGDGADELGFVRLNSPGNAHLDAYIGSCYKTLSSYCDTGYPTIADPQNVQAIAIDTNGDGKDELGFVRLNSANKAHLDAYTGPCYKTLSSYCDTGYPKITDPQNIRVLAIDTNGDGVDELGFLRYNSSTGKAHLDAYTGSCYTGLLGYSDSGYPAVSNPENVQALAMNLSYDPAPGAWYEDSLGGSITEDPDVSSWGPNRLDVFGRAPDGSYRHKWWGVSAWSGWEVLGSPGTIVSGVGTAGIGGNRVDAVGRTASNTVVDMWWNGSAWLTNNFGGNITGDPDFSSANGANYDIWARGAGGFLEHRWWNGSSWSPWESTGLAIASSPGAVSWSASRLDVVARASDNSVLHFWWNGSKWITENMGGNIQGAPDVSSWAPGRLDIFARGADNTLMHKYYNGTWSDWESLGGSLASSPGAVSWGLNRIDVVARATDNTVSHWYWSDP